MAFLASRLVFFLQKKLLSSKLLNIRTTRFDQSCPVHPVSESRGGGSLSVTHKGRRMNEGKKKPEILMSNMGCTATSKFNI